MFGVKWEETKSSSMPNKERKRNNIMKKTIQTGLLTLLAVILFWGCSSESYPGLEYENPDIVKNGETPDENKGFPINVYVNEQSVISLSSHSASSRESDMTRGVGPFQTEKDDDVKDGKITEYQRKLMDLKKDTTTFYIFAFRDKKALAAPDDDSQRLLLDPDLHWYQVEKENAPSGVTQDVLRLDCLIDGKDYYKGMRSNLDAEQLLKMDRPETSPLYWGEYQEVSYNFFAYSVGDVNLNPSMYLRPGVENMDDVEKIQWGIPHRDADSIWYENFAIDGSQDLMAGYAPLITKDMLEDGGRYAIQAENLTENEKKRILNDGNYTSFAAHRNIEPEIDLKHLLTRLRFNIVAGDSTASYTTIDSVYVTSPYRGNFVVAVNSKDKLDKIGFKPKMDETVNLYLHDLPLLDEDGHLLPSEIMTVDNTDEDNINKRTIPWDKKYWIKDETGEIIGKWKLSDRDHKSIGDDLLVPEQEQITLVIRSTYDPNRKKHAEEGVIGDNKREFRSRYVISAAAQADNNEGNKNYYDPEQGKFLFRRGYIYDITMVVYGLQKIQVDANIEGWIHGEDIDIDPDDTEDHEIVN